MSVKEIDSLEYDQKTVLISLSFQCLFEQSRKESSDDLATVFSGLYCKSDLVVRKSGLDSQRKWAYIGCCVLLEFMHDSCFRQFLDNAK